MARITQQINEASGKKTAGIRCCDSCQKEESLLKPRRWDVCSGCEKREGIASGRRLKAPIQVKKQSYINYCAHCKKIFEVKSRIYQYGEKEQKHCSSKCAGTKLIGRSPANKIYDRKDMSPRLQKLGPNGENEHAWRLSMLQKRNFTCEITGSKSNLSVHHIVPFHADPSLQFCEDNVVVITAEAHRKFHIEVMGGWNKAYTIEDWNDFVTKQKEIVSAI